MILLFLFGQLGTALADKVDDLVGKLKDKDNKVRLSAVLNLGKLGDKRAIAPLVDSLGDSDKTVRGVAAAALGKLFDDTVDAKLRQRALDALDKMQTSDPDSFARSQAAKAYAIVKALKGSGGSSGGTSGGGLAGGKTIYVEVGPFADKTTPADPKMLPLARKTVDGTLAKDKDIATKWPGGKSPTKADLTKAGVKAYYVDGTLTDILVTKNGSDVTITCRAAMLVATFPDKSVFGIFDPAKNKAEVDVSASDEAEGKKACVEALMATIVGKQVVPLVKSKSAAVAAGNP